MCGHHYFIATFRPPPHSSKICRKLARILSFISSHITAARPQNAPAERQDHHMITLVGLLQELYRAGLTIKKARSGIILWVTLMTSRSPVKTRGIAVLPKDRAAMSRKLMPSAICRMRSNTARAVLRFFCAQRKQCQAPDGLSQRHTPHYMTPRIRFRCWAAR